MNESNNFNKQNMDIIKELFKPLNKSINTIEELENIELDRDSLLIPSVKEAYTKIIDKCKQVYKTSKLTSLHNNRESKQKTPSINLIRQILKCNNLKLAPKVTSLGYSKITGKKIVKRSYVIVKIINSQSLV